jgi:hypothetical protein
MSRRLSQWVHRCRWTKYRMAIDADALTASSPSTKSVVGFVLRRHRAAQDRQRRTSSPTSRHGAEGGSPRRLGRARCLARSSPPHRKEALTTIDATALLAQSRVRQRAAVARANRVLGSTRRPRLSDREEGARDGDFCRRVTAIWSRRRGSHATGISTLHLPSGRSLKVTLKFTIRRARWNGDQRIRDPRAA